MIDNNATPPAPAPSADGNGAGSSETTIDRSTVDGLAQHFLQKAKANSQPRSAEPAIPSDSDDDEFLPAEATPPEAEPNAEEEPDRQNDEDDEGSSEQEEFTSNPEDESQLALRSLPKAELDRTYKVKASGGVVEVPLRDALLSYASHTERTRMAAGLREQERVLGVAADRYVAELTELGEKLSLLTPAEPDWDQIKREEGYESFVAKHSAWTQVERLKAETAAKKADAERQRAEQNQGQLRNFAVQQAEALVKRIPALKDEANARKFGKELNSYLASEGLTLNNIGPIDHRFLVIASKAMRFDQQRKASVTARSKMAPVSSSPAPSSSAPRRSNPPAQAQVAKARAAVQKSGSVADLSRLLMAKTEANQNNGRRRR